MEKLSERIDTLKPRNSQKLKADLVDVLIYAITLLLLINILFPIFNTSDYNWFKATITGSLFFVVINYFIRYYIPLRKNGRSIGKLLFNLQTVDYYGYEVKPSQLISKEAIYIFLPVLFFSKFTNLNYILIALWFLLFLKSVHNAYYLQRASHYQTLREAKEILVLSLQPNLREGNRPEKIELTKEQNDSIGQLLFIKLKEQNGVFKGHYKILKAKQKTETNDLFSLQKVARSKISKEDKDALYQLSLQHKLDTKTLKEQHKKATDELNKTYDDQVINTRNIELGKAQNLIDDNKEKEPDYVPVSEFVSIYQKFLNKCFEVEKTEGDKGRYEFEEIINEYNIDQFPKNYEGSKNDFLKSIRLQRTIEHGNTFIVDAEFIYEKEVTKSVTKTLEETVLDKKTNKEKVISKKVKEKIIVPKISFKTRTNSVICYRENEKLVFQFLKPKLKGKVAGRLKLHSRAQAVQSRSVTDLNANTITVDVTKFEEFFALHRTEE